MKSNNQNENTQWLFDVNQTSQDNDPPPHFEWRNLGRSVVVFVIDLILFAFATWVVFLFVRHLILNERIDVGLFSGDDWSKIVGHIAWPLAITLIVFLFRNPLLLLLYETQGLINRSYYRHGNIKDETLSRGIHSKSIGKASNETDSVSTMGKSELAIGKKVFSHMEKQFGVPLLRERCIRDPMYYFDAIAKVNNTLLAIELKKATDVQSWKYVFQRVQTLFNGFDGQLQRRFVFVACIAGNNPTKERQSLEDLAQQQDFRVVLRFYEIEGETVKEVL